MLKRRNLLLMLVTAALLLTACITGGWADKDAGTLKSPSAAPTAKKQTAADSVNLSLSEIIEEKGITDPASKTVIRVDKSDHVLSVYMGGELLKSYHVELGDGGLGDKRVEGDHKTPEGTLYVSEKYVISPADPYLGTRWMRLSYPIIEDANRGLSQGLIDRATHDEIVAAINDHGISPQDTALGGSIGIHGGSTAALGKDWTWGCVGLSSKDVEDFYNFVEVGTPVIIQL